MDPFVEFKVIGIPIEEQKNKKFRTKVIDDNGFNPRWETKLGQGANTAVFDIYCPEHSLLEI